MIFQPQTVQTKNGKSVILRMIQVSEVKEVLKAMIEIAESAPFILSTAEDFRKISIPDEEEWIQGYQDNPRAVLIGAEFEGRLMGILDFRCYKAGKIRHRGGLGISLHPDLRGEGLGELLFKKLWAEAAKIEGLQTIELSFMSGNVQAERLYRKVGFSEIGRRPKAYLQPDGSWNDDVMMTKEL